MEVIQKYSIGSSKTLDTRQFKSIKMEKLNREELKELMRLFFNKGVNIGKKIKPINEIPMGTLTKTTDNDGRTV